ncbi:3'-5' exonuclease [Metamycoplasma equirhinis]|uniref:3'-5' exonuclease n=1 Tax=Metamycoplasma equirhinis TaxID=92402 RepID=UPI003593D9FE
MVRQKFSKDPKVCLQTLEEFFYANEYLRGVTRKDFWEGKKPQPCESYYKFTSEYVMNIQYSASFTNFGMDISDKLECIVVAKRDGKTEYELFDSEIRRLQEERSHFKRSKKLDEAIELTIKAKKLLPKYQKEKEIPEKKPFEAYLFDTGYKTDIDELKNKFLVFDVETNGTRKSNDDLLSLSIYDPTTGICYYRFFPLDMQPVILTTFIHGIDDETIADAIHMDQDELNQLIEYFQLNDRVLLSFSGGQGTFDSSFIINYCKRHNLVGFENLKYENIKSKIPQAPFGSEGQLSKDNLCRMFGIGGVEDIHTSFNDCILEWKLYEKLFSECVFFIGRHLYKYKPEYIIPISYLSRHEKLVKYASINIPHITGEAKVIFKFEFPKSVLKHIKKFPTNTTGITIEHGINSYLNVETQDNFEFLSKNKSNLEYVGSIDSNIKEIPIIAENDGTVKAIKEEDKEYIRSVNQVTKIIIEAIKPVADYLKTSVFGNNKIMSQELAISKDHKVLALCDLSDCNNVVEIKTYGVLSDDTHIRPELAKQLYYQANGRNTFVLSLQFETHFGKNYEYIVDDLSIVLYKVQLTENDPTKMVYKATLNNICIKVLEALKENPEITKKSLMEKAEIGSTGLPIILARLEQFGYIKNENPGKRKSYWKILRDADDIDTFYIKDDNGIHIIDKSNRA